MTNKILLLITITAFLIRFINYRYPPLLWDEAAIGYNAYSLLQTGRDEYGQKFPLIFKSFGDYKPGLYIYATVPFVALFGLNELSVRLPSIIAGSLLPWLFFLLIQKLWPKNTKLALITALLLAFNPWNIHFSRGAWESNLLLFELVLACLLFLHRRFVISAVIFAAGLYTYQAGKILVPLLSLILIFQIKKIPKSFLIPLLLLSLPAVYGLLFGSDSNRLKVMSLSSYHRPDSEVQQIINESNPLDYTLFYSQPLFFLRNVATRYFNYFSPRFLIFEGDWQTARHSAPYVGVILYPTLFFFVIGFFLALKHWRSHFFFLAWLLIAPLPGALSLDIIQAVRALTLSLPILYFAALALSRLKLSSIWYLVLGTWYFFSFIYFLELYVNHLTKVNPAQWLVGYREAVTYVQQHGQNRHIIFTPFYGQPYIYYLFYSHYPPAAYQAQAKLTPNGVDTGTVDKIDQVDFQSPDLRLLSASSQPLLVIVSYDEIIRQGLDPDNFIKLSPLFYVYQN